MNDNFPHHSVPRRKLSVFWPCLHLLVFKCQYPVEFIGMKDTSTLKFYGAGAVPSSCYVCVQPFYLALMMQGRSHIQVILEGSWSYFYHNVRVQCVVNLKTNNLFNTIEFCHAIIKDDESSRNVSADKHVSTVRKPPKVNKLINLFAIIISLLLVIAAFATESNFWPKVIALVFYVISFNKM